MEHIKFPENSPSLIVIPSNKEGTGFLKYCYDERYLKGKATEEQFDSVVENCAKIAAKAYSKKRVMDKNSIGRNEITAISVASLFMFAYLLLLLIAGDSDEATLHYVSYIFMVPSLIIMIVLMIMNWMKSIKYFITFEEITKADLDMYFTKINNEFYFSRGLEWSTAQLGHFWIELRIKEPNVIENDDISKQPFESNTKFERKESEENRLQDDLEDDEEDKNDNSNSEQSDHSKKLSNRSKIHNVVAPPMSMVGLADRPSTKKMVAESISDDDSKDQSHEVFEINQDDKDFENFK